MMEHRHPFSRQPPPPVPGVYLVQEHPNDRWRPVQWAHGEFREGLTIRPWYAWKPIREETVQVR